MEEGLLWTTLALMAVASVLAPVAGSEHVKKENVEESLEAIHDVATKSLGSLCVTEKFRSLSVPLATARFESARQKADLVATLLQDLGVAHHNGESLIRVIKWEAGD
ncbi:putative G-protein coupled receptor CG31760-like Protein [Tribolium castaneum]|uniref:Putative G-protein coupled receptor CG31760-like Protein n=1 Tax=Tribolium castaneum TaxID=7070 RepID=D6WXS3_TRICA|nr:putative G-protein coupled receptor CG31760-like Protein [Tribolium castaneum]